MTHDIKELRLPEEEPSRLQRWWWDSKIGNFCDRVLTGIRVFFHRLELIGVMIPVLWRSHFDFDFEYLLPMLELRLQRLEKVLRSDPYHVDAAEGADQIKLVLHHLDLFQDPDRHIPKPADAEASFQNGRFQSNEAFGEWADRIHAAEEHSWEKIWAIIKENGRSWWC